jgi:flavodoxin
MSLPTVWKIIYASTSGNVESTCEYLADLMRGAGLKVQLERSERTDAADLISYQNFVFATSTWEHGEINPFFKPVLHDLANLNMAGKHAAFLGLGDHRYEPVWFCRGIEIAQEAFLKAGGQAFGETLKIDGEPSAQFETLVKPWADRLISQIREATHA